MDIIGDIIQNINNSFNIINNEEQEELETNELLAESLGMEDIMGVALQQWYAPFPQYNDYLKDNSYNTLSYLNKLGYTHAIWEVCESHKDVDVCDTLHGRQFTINELLLNAQHNPPSPMFTLSHPGCFCFLKVFPPAGPEGIPDNAPGLPYEQVTPITKKRTLKHKKLLYRKMFEVFIDAFTLLPPQDNVLKYSSTNVELLQKYGEFKSEVHTFIKPVKVNATLTCHLPLNLIKEIEEGMIGCQIKICNNFSIVYLCKLNRLVVLPTPTLTSFTFSQGEEVNTNNLNQGDFFVMEKDILGIYQHSLGKEFSCYIPEWNTVNTIEHTTVIKLQ